MCFYQNNRLPLGMLCVVINIYRLLLSVSYVWIKIYRLLLGVSCVFIKLYRLILYVVCVFIKYINYFRLLLGSQSAAQKSSVSHRNHFW